MYRLIPRLVVSRNCRKNSLPQYGLIISSRSQMGTAQKVTIMTRLVRELVAFEKMPTTSRPRYGQALQVYRYPGRIEITYI
jgi:hypothetical protein